MGASEAMTLFGAVAVALTAVFTGLSAYFLYRAAIAPFKVLAEERKDAAPSIVVDANGFWKVDVGTTPFLYLQPSGNGGIVEGLKLSQSTYRPLSHDSMGSVVPLPRLLFRVTNVGRSAAMDLRVPLNFSFLSSEKSGDLADASTLGYVPKRVTHTVELHIPSLPPAPLDYFLFIASEIGLQVWVESTGQAFDRDPIHKTHRTLVAMSPAIMLLPPAQ
jgi:hypothetical protein